MRSFVPVFLTLSSIHYACLSDCSRKNGRKGGKQKGSLSLFLSFFLSFSDRVKELGPAKETLEQLGLPPLQPSQSQLSSPIGFTITETCGFASIAQAPCKKKEATTQSNTAVLQTDFGNN